MKNLEIALCDTCSEYALKLAMYLLGHTKASVNVFTTPESFYADEKDYDIGIIAEDLKEIIDFRQKGSIKQKYYLLEEDVESMETGIYKYQSAEEVLNNIPMLKEAKASIKKSNEKSKLIGVYSPISHELQLPFAMAVSQIYRAKGNVLFIDLEELSILPELIGTSREENNLIDLLYEINTNSTTFDISKYVYNFMGFDYIQPFSNPNEISEIDEDSWNLLFSEMTKSNYDRVVILFGRTISGFSKYLEALDKLYVLGRPGDYYRKAQDKFFDYLSRIESNVETLDVTLPMSAGNLSDGTYQMEELLQGNLGMFVKKIITSNGNREYELYR